MQDLADWTVPPGLMQARTRSETTKELFVGRLVAITMRPARSLRNGCQAISVTARSRPVAVASRLRREPAVQTGR